MENTTVEDIQSEVTDAIDELEDVMGALRCADSCETKTDLIANLEDALASVTSLQSTLKTLLEEAKDIT